MDDKTKKKILNETTSFCNKAKCRECCQEEKCVLYRIKKILERSKK